MTDKKISQLTNITGSQVDDANDEIAIVDSSSNETKAITRAELMSSVANVSVDGSITVGGTVDGRDVASDGSKLDGIESGATADQTAGEIKAAYESNADTNAFTDAEQSKLAGIEAGADVTDTANVTAAGALMDSELTSEASVKALDQGVATTDSPEFAGLTVDTDTLFVDASTDSVGINNASPSASLDVTGDAEITGDLTVDTNTLYVDSANNRVGIGTSSPSEALHVVGTVISTGGRGTGFGYKTADWQIYNSSDFDLVFENNSSEAMRIDSSGNVLVGTTTLPNGSSDGMAIRSDGTITTSRSATSTINHMFFRNPNGLVGTIKTSGSSTSYNTSSDERLKENIADAQPASDLIDGIQVREFDWKADGEHQRYGMIAQELETVAPEAVTKGETEDDMWAVDYSKLVPMLVKEIQDLRKRVNELEATA